MAGQKREGHHQAAAATLHAGGFGRNHIERLRPAGKAARLRQQSLARAQADAQVECERPMNNLSDRRPQRPWNADKPEISAGSQQNRMVTDCQNHRATCRAAVEAKRTASDQRDGWRNGQNTKEPRQPERRQPSTREGNEMDWITTFAAIVMFIAVPVVVGMAMGYGLEEDDDER